jgi:hypothetical protein
MKNLKNILLVLFTLIKLCLNAQTTYPYSPQNQQYHITGTIGEERGARGRYHYGLDFNDVTQNVTPVFAIEGGIYYSHAGSVVVGHFAYIHVNGLQSLVSGVTNITAGQQIGIVGSAPEGPHVHLQQGTSLLGNITGFESTNIVWVNPITMLNPFADNATPRVDWCRLYRDNNHNNNVTSNLILFGNIDILLNTEDARINANGSADGYAVAPYNMSYDLLNVSSEVTINNTSFRNVPSISFANVPGNVSAMTVHGPNAAHNPANFEYWLTHDAYQTPFDRYWNTRQMRNSDFDVSANYPWDCDIDEGKKLRIRANSCDRTQCAMSDILPTSTTNYTIDNFKPFVKRAQVFYYQTDAAKYKIYDCQWNPDTNQVESSITMGAVKEGGIILTPDPPPTTGNFTVYAFASEEMKSMSASIPSLFPTSLSVVGTVVPDTEGKKWEFNFFAPHLSLAYGQCHKIFFTGKDNGGNDLIDFKIPDSDYLYCNWGTTKTKRIAKRTGASTWDFAVADGSDYVHRFRILECGFFKGEENSKPSACLEANEVISSVVYASDNSDGSISLTLLGNHSGAFVRWFNTNREQIGEGTQIKDLPAGVYCYSILEECCMLSDCIEVPACAITNTAQLTHPVGNVATGTIALTVTGATEPITYTWANGQNTKTISNLTSGIYCVTINDAYGCRNINCFTILGCPLITVSPSIILHPSSDCGASDGRIKILNLNATGGVSPYTFKWFNPDGTPNTQQGSLYNLVSGSYCLEATDVLGCKGKTCVFLGAKHEPLVDAQIAPACTGQNNGSIVVTAIDVDDGTSTYNFEWSNGLVTNGDFYSENFGLYSGTYTVTISSNAANCTVVKEFVVPQAVPTTALAVTTTVKHNCPGQNNGSITTTTTGGVAPFSYRWSTNPNEFGNPVKNNLEAGTYEVIVTDYCGSKVNTVVTLAPITIANSQVKSGCKDEGYASITVKNGNPSYTYHWSNGTNGNEVNSLSTGTHTVTVTDATGCTVTGEVQVQNKEYTFEQKGSCEALSNGTVDFNIHNPDNGPVSLIFNGETLLNSLTTNDVISVNKQGLPSDYVFSFQLNIDGCKYEMDNLTVETYQTTREFSVYVEDKNQGVCIDRVLCDGVPLDGVFFEYNPTLNTGETSSFFCKVPIFCGTHDTGESIKYSKKWLRVKEYKQMLIDVITGPLPIISFSVYEILYWVADNLYSDCDLVRYCPATLEVTAHLDSWHTPEYMFTNANNCAIYMCGEGNAIEICPGFEAPPISTQIIETFNSLPVRPCISASYSLFQLIIWTPHFLSNAGLFPRFLTSDLYLNHIIPHMNDPRARCINITFCTDSKRMFEVVNTPDYDAISCSDGSVDCVVEYTSGTFGDEGTVYCVDPDSDNQFNYLLYDSGGYSELYFENGWSYTILQNFPGHFFTNPDEESFKLKTQNRSSNVINEKVISPYTIYPNPFQSNFNLYINAKSTGTHSIEIIDISGKIVKNEDFFIPKGEQKIEIHLNEFLPSGFYFLKISDQNLKSKTFKLIKTQ